MDYLLMHEALKEQYIVLQKKYTARGLPWGSSLLLTPSTAIEFVDELEAIGVIVWGCDGWYTVELEDGTTAPVEDLGLDFSVAPEIYNGRNPVSESANEIRNFIKSKLLSNTKYVSLNAKVPREWEIFHWRIAWEMGQRILSSIEIRDGSVRLRNPELENKILWIFYKAAMSVPDQAINSQASYLADILPADDFPNNLLEMSYAEAVKIHGLIEALFTMVEGQYLE